MGRYYEGWVKLPRELWDIGLNPTDRNVLINCAVLANISTSKCRSKAGELTLQPGELVTSHAELSTLTGHSKSAVRAALQRCARANLIRTEPSAHGTIVELLGGTGFGLNNSQPQSHPNRTPIAPKQPIKELRIKKEELRKKEEVILYSEAQKISSAPPSLALPLSDSELSLANRWLKHAQSISPWAKYANWNPQAFGESIRKIKKKADLTDTGVAFLLEYIENDDFWSKNAVSPLGLLRKSGNGLYKLDNLLVKALPNMKKHKAMAEWESEVEAGTFRHPFEVVPDETI